MLFVELILGYFAWGGKNLAIIKFSQKTKYVAQSYLKNYFKYKNYDLYFSDQNKLFFSESNNKEKKEFRKYLENEYEKYFKKIINLVNKNEIETLFIYIPEYENLKFNYFEKFYISLLNKYKKPYLNIKKLIKDYDPDQIFLLPYDHHFTRFTNSLIAKELVKLERELNKISSKNNYCENFQGPLKRNSEYDIFIKENHPYVVRTNSIGFRDNKNNIRLSHPAHIHIVFGDSFTHGPYLSNEDTYPYYYLKNLVKFNNYNANEIEVINAGISSFTIRDYYNILEKYLDCRKADFIIIQITDNDLLDLSSLNYNRYNFLNENISVNKYEKDYYNFLLSNE